jgi:hypothetical protein
VHAQHLGFALAEARRSGYCRSRDEMSDDAPAVRVTAAAVGRALTPVFR